MARYKIVPERSRVWIDARSNLHPIHSTTEGLEGFVELELGPDGEVDLSTKPTGKLSLPVSRLSSGNRMEDREMQKRIEARRYPSIDGVLTSMEGSGSDDAYNWPMMYAVEVGHWRLKDSEAAQLRDFLLRGIFCRREVV